MAGSSVTETVVQVNSDVKYIDFDWVADDTDGSVPTTDSVHVADGYVILVVTDPGTTKPSDNYDITLKDSLGVDVMGGALDNRDDTLTEQAVPTIGSAQGGRYVAGVLTFGLTGNTVNDATGKCRVYISR